MARFYGNILSDWRAITGIVLYERVKVGLSPVILAKNRREHVRRHTSTLTVHGVFEAKENGLELVDHMGNLLVSSFFIFQLY